MTKTLIARNRIQTNRSNFCQISAESLTQLSNFYVDPAKIYSTTEASWCDSLETNNFFIFTGSETENEIEAGWCESLERNNFSINFYPSEKISLLYFCEPIFNPLYTSIDFTVEEEIEMINFCFADLLDYMEF